MDNHSLVGVCPERSGAPHPLLARLLTGVAELGVGDAFARDCLTPPSAADFARLLDALLDDPAWLTTAARGAYRHGNGFLKVPLCDAGGVRVRLHCWPEDDCGEENVHNHRWDMASRVLIGRLTSEHYDPALDAGPAAGPLAAREYEYRKERPGLAAEAHYLGRRALRLASRHVVESGGVYALHHETCHRVVKRDREPTITLMVQSAPVRAYNRMFCFSEKPPAVCPVALGSARLSIRLREVAALLRTEDTTR